MLVDFQLGAVVKTGNEFSLRRIPMHQALQATLAASWEKQYTAFVQDRELVAFSAGYTLEEHECFLVPGFQLPEWLQAGADGGMQHQAAISAVAELLPSIKAVVAFARTAAGERVMLAQGFSQSHVIQPGRFLFMEQGTYVSPPNQGFTLANRLTAVYRVTNQALLFESFRNTNSFLPILDFVSEASDQEINEVLSHALLIAEDADKTTATANQWLRKRFAMLHASGILDHYTTDELVQRSAGYEVALQVQNGRIVFPSDKAAAKRVLQFLNEELFKGAITEKLYETNSKREADE